MIALLLDLVLSVFDFIASYFIGPLITGLVSIFPTEAITNSITNITNLFSHIGNYTGFVLSYTGLYNSNLALLILLFLPTLFLPFAVHGLKLVARWWETLI